MIDTILIDLDGTLLRFSQSVFIRAYLAELRKIFMKMAMDAELSINAVLAGTKAMLANDGSALNSQKFWRVFADSLSFSEEKCKTIENACDNFYRNEFNALKSVLDPSDIPNRIVKTLSAKGYSIVLATNPLFPSCAVMTRLDWIGLLPQDFKYVTHYMNSTFCKPNHGYYHELFTKIGVEPTQCLMAGNSMTDDMCVSALGTETFLVTDYMENMSGSDITKQRHGTLADLEVYLMALPDIRG